MSLLDASQRSLAAAAALALAAASTSPASADAIVIVHGAFQSAADWTEVGERLEEAGHSVALVDLPGRDAARAVTLADHVAATQAAVDNAGEPVVLVGHSFGGMTISAVAEARPDEVRRLVYLAAYVPADGESMEALSATDTGNGFSADTFVVAADYSYAEINPRDRGALFASDGTDAQKDDVAARMVREPLGPIATPVSLTPERFEAVDKAYVRTLRDEVVSTELQTRMIERAGIAEIVDIDTGHAPQATRPEELAGALLLVTALR